MSEIPKKALHNIIFEPIGRRGDAPADEPLLETARQLGVDLVAICGGEGNCGQCRVQVLVGSVSPPTRVEQQELSERELAEGYRLACQAYPKSNLQIHVPPASLSAPQRAQVEGLEVPVQPDSVVKGYELKLTPPSIADLSADIERVREALRSQYDVQCKTVDVEVLRELSPKIREWNWHFQGLIRDNELVAFGTLTSRRMGIAFDLGTTKIAGYLVDLATGVTLAAKGTMNPQIAYGEDLITRLNRARSAPAEARRLQELVVDTLNSLTEEMCVDGFVAPEEIVDAVVVANTAMHHLFLGLPTEQLLMSPYVPSITSAFDIKARDVGLKMAPGAYLHVLPNIAGYVGADHVAMILATGVYESKGLVLALDIGTNTEICLVSDGEMTSVSTASGPAFEGAHIKYGMRAAPGAIEHVKLEEGRLDYETIGGEAPVGICGSGILDAVAQMFLAGVLNRSGKMCEHSRVRQGDTGREFLLADFQEDARRGQRSITITQKDVREVQLAKGAMRAGIQVLLQSADRREEEIDRVIIAGAFGNYISPASAVAIGMLPDLPLERFTQVGNAAGTGARLALISREKRAQAAKLAARVRYIELAGMPQFSRIFSRAIFLGH